MGRWPLASVPELQPVKINPRPVHLGQCQLSAAGRLRSVGRDPSAGNIAQGPPNIGSIGCAAGSKTPRRSSPARGWAAEARAMFLANIYALF
tara:strand:+ start:636 stop:911 length:276 start_codon:yes stop_codon:yes gene_type:complete